MQKIIQILNSAGLPHAPAVERAFNDLFSRQVFNSAGLAVSGTTTLFKTVNTIYAVVNGTTVVKTTADFPALTGYNLTSGQVGGFVATMDAAGVLYVLTISPAATLGQIVYPLVPPSQVAIGLVLLNVASPATFTGGTTVMTAAAPIVYVNLTGPFAPTNLF